MKNQLKSALEAAQKEPNAIPEERNAWGRGVYLRGGSNGCEKDKRALGASSAGGAVEIAQASVCSRYI